MGLIRISLKIDIPDAELRAEIQRLWPSLDERLAALLVPIPHEDDLTIGKVYGSLLIFDHWRHVKDTRIQKRLKSQPDDKSMTTVAETENMESIQQKRDSRINSILKDHSLNDDTFEKFSRMSRASSQLGEYFFTVVLSYLCCKIHSDDVLEVPSIYEQDMVDDNDVFNFQLRTIGSESELHGMEETDQMDLIPEEDEWVVPDETTRPETNVVENLSQETRVQTAEILSKFMGEKYMKEHEIRMQNLARNISVSKVPSVVERMRLERFFKVKK